MNNRFTRLDNTSHYNTKFNQKFNEFTKKHNQFIKACINDINEINESTKKHIQKLFACNKQLEENSKKLEKATLAMRESIIKLNENILRLSEEMQNLKIKKKCLTDEDINKYLNETEINENSIIELNKQDCIICLEKFSISDKICFLPCLHYFHSICIKSWAKQSNKCPLCKNPIKTD